MANVTAIAGSELPAIVAGLAARDSFIEANASRWDADKAVLGFGAYILLSGVGDRRMMVARGRSEGIARLCAAAAGEIGALGFALVSYGAEDIEPVLAREFGLTPGGDWVWLYARELPPAVDGEEMCGPLPPEAAGEIGDLLGDANPSTSASPSDDDLTWWGYREQSGRLLSACALRLPTTATDGVHLSGFGTHPDARGRGIGTAMMAAMTRWGVRTHGLVHYGVWSDNAGALRIYERLGYRQAAHLQNFHRASST